MRGGKVSHIDNEQGIIYNSLNQKSKYVHDGHESENLGAATPRFSYGLVVVIMTI